MPTIDVLDTTIAYRQAGTTDGAAAPVVFLHGNPTSSYLWRRVLPQVAGLGRCLAPDLVGMGDSGKPDIAYRFADHARYLDAFFDALGLDDVLLVGHDWGAALAFDWGRRHPERVRGVAFMETILRPMTWDDLPAPAHPLFKAYRTRGEGEAMVLERNAFVEEGLPRTVASGLSEEDMDAYRRPYPTPESRRPLLAWPRELPIDGEPADVVARVEAYDGWLAASHDVPKLLVAFDPGPGTMIGPPQLAWCAGNVANLEIARAGRAGHHAPEDQPDAIALALVSWAKRHGLVGGRPSPEIATQVVV